MAKRFLLIAFAFAFMTIIAVAWIVPRMTNLYYRSFGDHIVQIWISADDAGSTQQKIHGSYFPRFAIIGGYNSVNLPPTYSTPTFTTFHEPSDKLICIYDNNDYGFLMIVDQSDHDWYIGGMSIGVNISPKEKWLQHFNTIKAKHPGVPYSHYFRPLPDEPDEKAMDQSPH